MVQARGGIGTRIIVKCDGLGPGRRIQPNSSFRMGGYDRSFSAGNHRPSTTRTQLAATYGGTIQCLSVNGTAAGSRGQSAHRRLELLIAPAFVAVRTSAGERQTQSATVVQSHRREPQHVLVSGHVAGRPSERVVRHFVLDARARRQLPEPRPVDDGGVRAPLAEPQLGP